MLVENGMRGRVRLQIDGGMRTGRDVMIAALLGAEEYGMATASLIAMGCVMLRKCHLNTCSVGIATQDPVLREKFQGTPEGVVHFFLFVAREVRELLSRLGARSLDEVIGRRELLRRREDVEHWKARRLDLSPMLVQPRAPADAPRHCVEVQQQGRLGPPGPGAAPARPADARGRSPEPHRAPGAQRPPRGRGDALRGDRPAAAARRACPTTASGCGSRARRGRASARSSPPG